MPATVAWFISPHGFGHAARSCAVIEGLQRRHRGIRIVVLSTVPAWFLERSVFAPVERVPVVADLGLVQRTPMEEDLEATAAELARMPWDGTAGADVLDRTLDSVGPDLVVADISPFGLAAASRMGVPSLLMENFTWDWIYRGYVGECPALDEAADRLQVLFEGATRRVQLTPFCESAAGASAVSPVARPARERREVTRRRLGVGEAERMVLVSMGGIPWVFENLERLERASNAVLVAPGSGPDLERRGNLVRLPHRSAFHHPDLVAAADAVVGKLGYSTVAEAWAAGRPMGWLIRDRFREGPVLEPWVRREVGGARLRIEDFATGAWVEDVADLVQRSGGTVRVTGVAAVCEVVADMLGP
jgi:hypothetical protein